MEALEKLTVKYKEEIEDLKHQVATLKASEEKHKDESNLCKEEMNEAKKRSADLEDQLKRYVV